MARPQVEVRGARKLRSTLKRAGVQLKDLRAAHAEVAAMVAGRAAPGTPRRTGALAGTLRSSGTQSAAVVRAGRGTVDYARVVHYRYDPWISEAAESSQDSWERIYLQAIEQIIDRIEGL